jgi:hypothetical protein
MVLNMKIIKNIKSDIEREFAFSKNTHFNRIILKGELDGESAFKECNNIVISNSKFYLRYPCWHNSKTTISNTFLAKTARAPFWYDKKLAMDKVTCNGVKAIRECNDVVITNSKFVSPEFGWNVNRFKVDNSYVEGPYAFFGCKNVEIDHLDFKGKYSFQYVKNLKITNSHLDTKDAFWHTKNAVIENCELIGEYIAWYSENLTFINCKIKGTQPFCYAKGLKLINCELIDCDLSFENTEVNGDIKCTNVSIKNPLKGVIVVDKMPEMIVDNHSKSKDLFLIKTK